MILVAAAAAAAAADDDDDDDDAVVSVMAQKLVDLAIAVLREAVTTENVARKSTSVNDNSSDGPAENDSDSTGDKTSVQLFYTARNMFEMFSSLVPVYHHQLLSSLPQLAGKSLPVPELISVVSNLDVLSNN